MATLAREVVSDVNPSCKHNWEEMGRDWPRLEISWYGVKRYTCFECGGKRRVILGPGRSS